MNRYLFFIHCVCGGIGWGQTGQYGYVILDAASFDAAEKEVKRLLPGGWEYEFLKTTSDPAEICTDASKRH